MANYTYQISLEQTQAKIVTILSSMSSLFTLFLAASFPSNGGDKFTLSKLAAVVVSIFGLVSWKFINANTIKQNNSGLGRTCNHDFTTFGKSMKENFIFTNIFALDIF